ncbi:MAG: TOBE domain-containing protein, partial [Niameybacter sp.]
GFGNQVSVDVVIRPEDIRLVKEEEGMLQGTVESVTFKGVHYEMIINANEYRWMVHSTAMAPVGNRVGMVLTPEDIHIMRRG